MCTSEFQKVSTARRVRLHVETRPYCQRLGIDVCLSAMLAAELCPVDVPPGIAEQIWQAVERALDDRTRETRFRARPTTSPWDKRIPLSSATGAGPWLSASSSSLERGGR